MASAALDGPELVCLSSEGFSRGRAIDRAITIMGKIESNYSENMIYNNSILSRLD
jgi:hypothetical protein